MLMQLTMLMQMLANQLAPTCERMQVKARSCPHLHDVHWHSMPLRVHIACIAMQQSKHQWSARVHEIGVCAVDERRDSLPGPHLPARKVKDVASSVGQGPGGIVEQDKW